MKYLFMGMTVIFFIGLIGEVKQEDREIYLYGFVISSVITFMMR